MKKLAATQIILGILIIVSAYLFLVHVTPGYDLKQIIDAEGNIIGKIHGLTKLNVFLHICLLIYFVLGLAVTSVGTAQFFQTMRRSISKGLTITQIILGVLIITSLVVFTVWAERDWQPIRIIVDSKEIFPEAVMIRYDPKWIILLKVWKTVSFILGLAVLGCGIAQFVKARRILSEKAIS